MKRSFRSILAVITVAATLLPIVNIIEADEASVETASQVVNLFDAVAKYPVPSWFKPGNYFEQFEPYKEQKGATFILEQIPKGESFDKWSKLFAVLAYQSSNLTMEKLVNVMLGPIYQMCGKAHFSSKPVDRTPDGDTYIVTCQKTPNGTDKLGYGEDIGQVSLITFRSFKNTYVTVYQHWRGKSFDNRYTETWPVTADTLDLMVRRLRTVELTPK